MAHTFYIDQAWVNAAPSRSRDRRIREGLITAFLLTVSWFVHIYLFWFAAVVACIYWLSDLLCPGGSELENFANEYRVELRDEGLFRYYRDTNGKPVSVLSPWTTLKVQSVDRRSGQIKRIRLNDGSLPRGVRTVDLEGLEGMGALLSKIESRLAHDGSND